MASWDSLVNPSIEVIDGSQQLPGVNPQTNRILTANHHMHPSHDLNKGFVGLFSFTDSLPKQFTNFTKNLHKFISSPGKAKPRSL
ncbi:hypothetical protein LYNGBM3L_70110 [Moorena producens 3L]|uniref:Uncharacterized protein n=2 Tax=Moorena producens TaxID=1155739 RepID=A0A1D9G8U5_MOOP1|nr:hypothetical protein LYNGBM3L_70110 [Moorena producens 3L]OLT66602.1 hypothetical protein BI334_17700 [Moorena producens 3L]